ncbi:DNA fragmentation factor subunit alpha-like [Sinocyclocheilus rhinocerous]|uniref:DNA fragmentation factor subunit alpha-like n=1 Tax=Sinocyclocheilus rhinocerous TaxID=307959 RepID=A0A673NNL8_9TELE|nr:PREDICTED: DNA fragmentation factor subunit alpha-like [Sinocyclocheilus rhinocerous]
MAELKACKVCNISREKHYGLAVTSLDQLKIKGGEALGFSPSASVSVVLEVDGTIVVDEAYFMCLPANTKFMLLHADEIWMHSHQVDGGTAQPCRKSTDLEVDGKDTVDGFESWRSLAEQLRQDLASIILLSEADLQSLIDVPCSDLAAALDFSQQKTQVLQDTLQRMLDRREEERQSKELLRLYLKAMERESTWDPQEDSARLDETDGVQVEAAAGFRSTTIMLLKDKKYPETRLSNEELQMVAGHGVEVMMEVLGWDCERTSALVQACESELSKRLQRVQALQSLSAQNQSTSQPHTERETRAKRCKKHTH